MNKMLLVSEVAALSLQRPRDDEIRDRAADLCLDSSFNTGDSPQQPSQPTSVPDASDIHSSMYYKSLNSSQRQLIMQQLDAWEEPVRDKKKPVSYCERCFKVCT